MNGDWVEWILKLGGVSVAITGIGRVLLWVYEKSVLYPITNALGPLTSEIKKLNDMLCDSEVDREALHVKIMEQSRVLINHEYKIDNLEKFRQEHIDYHKGKIIDKSMNGNRKEEE